MTLAAVPCLVVLAAGMGSRFGGDKQLAQLGSTGRTLLHFSVMDAYNAGVRQLILVIRAELTSALEHQVLPHFPADLTVQLVLQQGDDLPAGVLVQPRDKPWGTAHALWCARDAVQNSPMIVINADDYYGSDAMRLLVQHFMAEKPVSACSSEAELNGEWAMVAFELSQTLSAHGGVNRGLCVVQQHYLQSVTECCDIRQQGAQLYGQSGSGQLLQLDPAQAVSMNIWGFSAAIMPKLAQALTEFFQQMPQPKAECYLPSVVNSALQQGQLLKVYLSHQRWFGVTYPADLAEIVDHFQTKNTA
ncbi:MAG TPA: hypothetical protein DF774_15525 [Rheinheimera sp.]|uniref:nucleotidyltransferase family protein n=1 Tax=Rheinheimera sp. TaxID=1869214 RepID=UPI000ED5B63C|nr:NTP transferase domain-containing protein [Rheinheimera sp.]HCU67160.1 hypothetical protein [Rheinheimera sp.]